MFGDDLLGWYTVAMGLPAELLDAFEGLSPAAESEAEAQASFWTAAERGDVALEKLNHAMDLVETALGRFEAAVQRDIKGGATPDLSSAVDFLEQREQQVKADYLPRLAVTKKMLSGVFQLPAPARPRAMAVFKKRIATYTRVLQSAADMKLRMIALRARAEPLGDSPMITDAEEFERQFDALAES